MSAARAVLLLIFGFTMLKFICCYSDGSLLTDQCQSMAIDHGSQPSVQVSNPLTIVPDNVTVDSSKVGTNFTVTLSASVPFTGYMLEARECDNCPPAGIFSGLDSTKSVLICSGQAVAQPDNNDKTLIQVNWTPNATGQFFFRSAFIQSFSTFCLKKAIILPTTTTPTTTTTTTTTTATTTTTTRPTTATVTSSPATCTIAALKKSSLLLQCVQYMRSCVVLLLFSRLCFLGGSSLLMIIKPVSKKPTQIASIIEVVLKFVATVLVLIKAVHYLCENAGLQFLFAALIVTAMVTGLIHTITVFLHCGPRHELRTCWICSLIIVDLLNTLITSISIFYGLWWFQGRWLLIVMAVYVILEFILYLGAAVFEWIGKRKRVEQNRPVPDNRQMVGSEEIQGPDTETTQQPDRRPVGIRLRERMQTLEITRRAKSPWLVTFVIFCVFYIMFTVALIVGVCLVSSAVFL